MNRPGTAFLGRRLPASSLTLVLLLAGAASAFAAEPPRALRPSYLTNGASVREAFRDVVATPRRWTVQVIVDGNTVALGTIVDTDGFVLTKASELTDGPIRCRLFDGRTVDAAWTAAHPDHDIAMLKIDADGLTAAEWASEVDPRPGQWLATPGLTRIPVSVGIVSTAPHNIKEVHVAGVLGVELEREKEAARIKAITPNSGADDAGLKPGDVIEQIAEIDVDGPATLVQTIRKHRPGDTLELIVRRGDVHIPLSATLTHPFGPFLSRIAMQNRMGGDLSDRRTGFPRAFVHDSVLRPEDCGGTLVNLDGLAVAMNIARAGRTESVAIPAAVVVSVLDDLKSGKYSQPTVGQELAAETTSGGSAESADTSTGDKPTN
ncbi:PDZ domain-containing protein [Maioricimonas sp. JC845]|uniref:S1C family serine protease n=1 Tax=Maioricimonas sp. JC845 TaxID=3232138 RepID=UPI0034586AA3